MADPEAIELIYNNLGALPDSEFGVINLLPWAVDNKETNAIKKRVAAAIVDVFESAGYPMSRAVGAEDAPRTVSLHCRACSTLLFTAPVSTDGIANVPAANLLSSLARLSTECPHKALTLDDQRRLIEEALSVDSV